jgi:hypothetical protein
VRWALISVILAFTTVIAVPAALADGDPASDVLVSFQYFDPIDLSLPPATTAELSAVLSASSRAGFPIRVAMIASPMDLGTVTSLWRDPGAYAGYLQDELSNLFAGQILVVMPNGFGLHGPSGGAHAVTAAESSVRALAPGPGAALARAALSAVPRLAAAAGHPIPATELSTALHAVARRQAAPAGDASAEELLALVIGALMIAVAWAASLWARPLQGRGGAQACGGAPSGSPRRLFSAPRSESRCWHPSRPTPTATPAATSCSPRTSSPAT